MALLHATRYDGLLGINPDEQRLRVWTQFDADSVELGTQDGERFAWSTDAVFATPYDTRTMELYLDGTLLYFVADDPLTFADDFSAVVETSPLSTDSTERPWSTRTADPLDRRTTIPVFRSQPDTTPPLRRSVDRDRLVPLGRKGKLRRPKKHTHSWTATDSTYGLTRYVCNICRHVTIDMTGPGAVTPLTRA